MSIKPGELQCVVQKQKKKKVSASRCRVSAPLHPLRAHRDSVAGSQIQPSPINTGHGEAHNPLTPKSRGDIVSEGDLPRPTSDDFTPAEVGNEAKGGIPSDEYRQSLRHHGALPGSGPWCTQGRI